MQFAESLEMAESDFSDYLSNLEEDLRVGASCSRVGHMRLRAR